MPQNDRLNLLKRKSVGSQLLPKLREQLALAVDMSPESLRFLPLEGSDEIRGRISQSFPPRDQLERRRDKYPFISKRVADVTPYKPFLPEGNADIFLILPEADSVGVLQLSMTIVNRKWRELLSAKPDGFILVDTTFTNKSVVERDADEATGQEFFAFAAWGTEWSNALRDLVENS
jgi:hypothetical protein